MEVPIEKSTVTQFANQAKEEILKTVLLFLDFSNQKKYPNLEDILFLRNKQPHMNGSSTFKLL